MMRNFMEAFAGHPVSGGLTIVTFQELPPMVPFLAGLREPIRVPFGQIGLRLRLRFPLPIPLFP